MSNLIATKLYHSRLFAAYGNLLTKKQQTYFELYVNEDYSLNEISVDYEISRAAVSDSINKTIKVLENFELNLQLVAKTTALQAIIAQYENNSDLEVNGIIKKLKELV